MIYHLNYCLNFRDASTYVSSFAMERIYRSAALCMLPDQAHSRSLCQEYRIATIIDLRAEREVIEQPYRHGVLEGVHYISIPFDPWKQPEWFKQSEFHTGSGNEIAYRYFIVGCREQVRQALLAILRNPGAVLIHCVYGKDRTGCIIAILALLTGAGIEEIVQDYLASAQDTQAELILMALALIAAEGGIESYLRACGLSIEEIRDVRFKIQRR